MPPPRPGDWCECRSFHHRDGASGQTQQGSSCCPYSIYSLGLKFRNRLVKFLAVSGCLLLCASEFCMANFSSGLSFKSFEVNPSERTSLVIPSTPERPLSFRDSLEVSFLLQVNLDLGRFGYIFRTILNNSESVDVLLYTPYRGTTSVCATGDHENLIRIPISGDCWQKLRLVLKNSGGTTVAFLNDQEVATIKYTNSPVSAILCFGKNNIGSFVTHDVAPMTIKDLKIVRDGGRPDFFKLDDLSSLSKSTGIQAAVENPVWRKDLNSHWNFIWKAKLPSVSYICPDSERSVVYIISDKQVTAYDLRRMRASQWNTAKDIKIQLIDNDFLILKDGTLAYHDIDSRELIKFDPACHDWERDNPIAKHSSHLHNNLIYHRASGNFIEMFGYGQHRYSNNLFVWNPEEGSSFSAEITELGPRYMAAAGISGDKIYVFSGRGNTQGVQELGTKIYGDLVEIDVNDFSARVIWSENTNSTEVAAADLLFEHNKDSFLTLCYNPDEYKTSLQLRRYDKDGSYERLGECLPYNFLDIESEARLVFSEHTQCYYAFITQKEEDGSFSVCAYSIMSPVLASAELGRKSNGALPWIWAAIGVLLIAAVIAIRHRSHKETSEDSSDADEEVIETQSEEPVGPGIHLLGTFRAISADGLDISANFSPMMKQILCILILNSDSKQGISNTQLKDTLWYDKSDESYHNNKGVMIKKIRGYLEQVDLGLAIVSNKGYWSIEDKNGKCDYLTAMETLLSPSVQPKEIIKTASLGNLLTDLHFEWLDTYKSKYENLVIGKLEAIPVKPGDEESARRAINWADAMLAFDSLNEDSIRIKCRALITLRRNATAKRVFENFKEYYRQSLGEEFDDSFDDFLKKQVH